MGQPNPIVLCIFCSFWLSLKLPLPFPLYRDKIIFFFIYLSWSVCNTMQRWAYIGTNIVLRNENKYLISITSAYNIDNVLGVYSTSLFLLIFFSHQQQNTRIALVHRCISHWLHWPDVICHTFPKVSPKEDIVFLCSLFFCTVLSGSTVSHQYS